MADKKQLLQLWRETFGDYAEERYDWLYLDNPHGSRCFVLESAAGRIVGAAAVTFRILQIEGRSQLGVQAVDFAIDKPFRFGGAALQLQKRIINECEKLGASVIYGFPLPGARVIQRRLGFSDVGGFERWVLPIHCGYKLEKRVQSRMVRRLLCIPIDLFFSLGWRWPNRLASTLKAATSSARHERLETVARNHQNTFSVVGERTSSYLKWRFHDEKFSIFTLTDKKGSAAGYVVYSRLNCGLQINDIFGTDLPHWQATLVAFIRRMYRDKPDFIELNVLAGENCKSVLRKTGFRLRPGAGHVLAYWVDRTEKEAPQSEHWYLTSADKDG